MKIRTPKQIGPEGECEIIWPFEVCRCVSAGQDWSILVRDTVGRGREAYAVTPASVKREMSLGQAIERRYTS